MYSLWLAIVALTLSSSGSASSSGKRKFVDLSYTFNNDTILFPGRKSTFNIEFEGFTANGYWLASKGFCTSEHTSTHIDAPYHFHKNGRTLDQIPLEDLIGVNGVMIDIYSKVYQEKHGRVNIISNYVLTREDVLEWEKVNGQIPPKSVVLLRSGWGSRWPDKNLYFGQTPTDPDDVSTTTEAPPETGEIDFTAQTNLNFPGFSASVAKFLVTERDIIGVGIDTLSIDKGSDPNFLAHQVFAARGIYMIENVANLHLIPATGFKLWMLPFKIDKGTGAPIRIIAGIDKDKHDRDL